MIMIMKDIEAPAECHECPFQLRFKDGEAEDGFYMRRCVIENRIIEYPRPKWCPIRNPEGVVLVNRLIENISRIIIEFGQNDKRFHIGDQILYTPSEICQILLRYKNELMLRFIEVGGDE